MHFNSRASGIGITPLATDWSHSVAKPERYAVELSGATRLVSDRTGDTLAAIARFPWTVVNRRA